MNEPAFDPTDASPEATPVQPAAVPVLPRLDPVAVFFALGSGVRLPIIRMLANGEALSVGAIAGALGRDIDGVGKQLFVLRNAGVVSAAYGEDRRQTIYQIPANLRPAPGVLDVGFARIDVRQL